MSSRGSLLLVKLLLICAGVGGGSLNPSASRMRGMLLLPPHGWLMERVGVWLAAEGGGAAVAGADAARDSVGVVSVASSPPSSCAHGVLEGTAAAVAAAAATAVAATPSVRASAPPDS